MSNLEFNNITFDLPKNISNVIKVIGVGGGGSNAINHMFQQGIKGVDFVVCNTDAQALQNSPVANKIQLGVSLTEGLGAGANPDVGEESAIESLEEIKTMLETNTKMVFITAGMGGGTGTGAAPIIAKMARELDILTVGIVTVPFQFEGKTRNDQALAGVEKLRKHVDSLIVINNNKLREVYGNLGFKAGFSKADEVLATASRGIAEVITHHYTQNIDLRDAKTVLSNSGTAIMGSASASGNNRAQEAIVKALDSPLLNDNKITGAKNVLLLIVSGSQEITIDEIGEISDYIQTEAGFGANIIMGVGEEETLDEAVSVTIIATGFDVEQQHEITNTEAKKIIHSLEEDQKVVVQDLTPKTTNIVTPLFEEVDLFEEKQDLNVASTDEIITEEPVIKHTLVEEEFDLELIPTSELIKSLDVVYEEITAVDFNEKHEFIITDITNEEILEIEVNDPEFVAENEDETIALSFELPLNEQEDASIDELSLQFDLTDDIREIEVNEPIEIIPITEVSNTEVKKYSLDDYMNFESKTDNTEESVIEEEEIVFETKIIETTSEEKPINDNEDPFDVSIEESLKNRAEERRRRMKDFNYKFKNNAAKIDEIEKEPAYKRQGVELDETKPSDKNDASRMSLGTDENNDIQLRSNNSFLHDNVD